MSSEQPAQKPLEFKFGDRVIVHLSEDKHLPGRIDRVLSDGLYSVLFDAGGRKIVDLTTIESRPRYCVKLPASESKGPRSLNGIDVIVRCYCKSSEDNESLVQCENCYSWQHLECLEQNKTCDNSERPPCPYCLYPEEMHESNRPDYARWIGKLLPDYGVRTEAEDIMRKESAVSYLLEAALECIDIINELKAKLILAEDPSVADEVELRNKSELLERIAKQANLKQSSGDKEQSDQAESKPGKVNISFGDTYRKSLSQYLEDVRSRLDLRLDYIETRIDELEEEYGPDFDPDELGSSQSHFKSILNNLYKNLESFKKIHCHVKRRRMNSDEHTSSSDDDFRQPQLNDSKAN